MRVFIGFVLLLFIFFAHPGKASATNFYVSNSGTDSASTPGTQNEPWRTIQYAVTQKDRVRPGDTIIILPGTYREQVVMNGSTQAYEGRSANSSVQGTDQARITIRGSNPANPPIITNGQNAYFQWLMIDVSNLTIKDIAFKNYYYSGVKVFAKKKPMRNLTLSGLTLYNQQVPDYQQIGWGGYFGIVASSQNNGAEKLPITNIRIENNYLEKIQTKKPDGRGHECIRFDGEIQKGIIANNTIIECQSLAIDILGLDRDTRVDAQPNYIVVRNNTILNMYKTVNVSQPKAVYMDRAGKFLLVENNVSKGRQIFFHTNVESNPGNLEGYGNIIARNNVSKTPYQSIIIGLGGLSGPAVNAVTNNKFVDYVATVHNIFINDASSPHSTAPVNYTGSRFTTTKNNVIYALNSNLLQQVPDWTNDYAALRTAQRESNGNLWYSRQQNPQFKWTGAVSYSGFRNFQQQTQQDLNSLFETPQFMNAQNDNYKLQASSPGTGDAVPLTYATQNMNNSRQLVVRDAQYFYDGWNIPGEKGDRIKIGNQEARVTAVNYATNTLTLDRSLSWQVNTPIHYYFDGTAPNIGLLSESFFQDQPAPDPTPDPTPPPVTPDPTPDPTPPPVTPDPTPDPTPNPNDWCSWPLEQRVNITRDTENKIDIFDYNALVGAFGTITLEGNPYLFADINCSGQVDIFDYNLLVGAISTQ